MPARWIQIKDMRLHQSQSFKVYDYLSGIGAEAQRPLALSPAMTDLSVLSDIEATTVEISDQTLDQLLKAFPVDVV